MLRLTHALPASVMYAFLAAPFSGASVAPRAPHITGAVAEANPSTITAVSECHFHGTLQFCQAGTTEFRIAGTATASSYTDCHSHASETWCMAPTGEVQIFAEAAGQTAAPAPTPAPGAVSSITAVSECHMHDASVFCMAGPTEYLVHTTATATQDVPPAYTDCHAHGAETFCQAPGGDEVEISLATAESDHHEEDEEAHGGRNCHFHAGVEHCTGGSTEATCERVDRDYNIRLRIGLLFVMLVTSSIGVFSPIVVANYVSPGHIVFTILKQFGTGIIISTAFIHLFTHAVLMFRNECLGELEYEATAAAILMAGLFLSFLVEYAGSRFIQWHASKSHHGHVESGHGHSSPLARTDMVNISVLEAGVVFHSLLIGLTLVVAADSFFLTLFAVIVFHQMFEGIALGTRIAALGRPCPPSAAVDVHGNAHHGHAHAHGHEHYHPDDSTAPSSAPASVAPETEPKPKRSSSGADSSHTEATEESMHGTVGPHVSMRKKLLLALAFALVTPVGMAIGIGVLQNFNGNDPATVIAIGTLDALSAGILVWVGVVEMWAHDWMLGGEMTRAGPVRTVLGLLALVTGLVAMSVLGKWA
ncbi:hypothetical protein VTK26DRAFT_730 [Humicola hyalothermophila]